MPPTLLTAYARPMAITFGATDHTYVKSSHGDVWPCFGESTGGRTILTAEGSRGLAQCYARHDSEAGLYYGVTGVCHQAANRILAPTSRLVTNAPFFVSATSIFGDYGLPWVEADMGIPKPEWVDDWSDREARCRPPDGPHPPRRPESPDRAMARWLKRYNNAKLYSRVLIATIRRIRRRAKGGDLQASVRAQLAEEIRLLTIFRLGPRRAEAEGEPFVVECVEMYERRVVAAREYLQGRATFGEYGDQLNELLPVMVERLMYHHAVRSKTIHDFFGDFWSEPGPVVDPGTMVAPGSAVVAG